jgi:PhoH-like ATPase
MVKNYVLDTNVLLSNSNLITEAFDDNNLIIPLPVIEELDRLKERGDTVGYNAREVLRQIEKCREHKIDFVAGIKRNDRGGLLRILPIRNEAPNLNTRNLTITTESRTVSVSPGFDLDIVDNLIILTVLKIKEENLNIETIFVSNDCNARIKASLIGIRAEEYREQKVEPKILDYSGFQIIKKPLSFFGGFSAKRVKGEERIEWVDFDIDEIPMAEMDERIEQNEYVLIDVEPVGEELDDVQRIDKKDYKKLKKVYRRKGDNLVLRPMKFSGLYGGFSSKNLEQSCALDLLLDDDIKVVTIGGVAGTGKTILSVVSAFQKVIKDKVYDRIVFLKPTITAHEDIGYLKGDMMTKLNPFMSSFIDNINVLKKSEAVINKKTSDGFDELVKNGIIEVEHIGFIRGRSFNNCIIIADELQNVGRPVMKTIVSRVGENCKIICLGDVDQIDASYLSKANNGLSHLINKFKGQEVYGHITLKRCERSQVATLAAALL